MKATNKQIDKGQKLAKNLKTDILYINDNGEFFTSENLALLSVKNDKNRCQKLDYSAVIKSDEASEELTEIKSLKTIDEVQSILDTELEGAGREEIIKACEDRIRELEK